jgi:alpha-L-rhamnosidase
MGGTNSKLIPKEFVAEFYLLKALKITAFAHKLAGNADPCKLWQERLEEKKRDFKAKYVEEDGACRIAEQSAIAMVMHLGASDNAERISAQLVEVVLRDRLSLTCGMVGVQYLYGALSDAKRADLAYKMIAESEPGYKTWYLAGATTLWERWDGANDGSHNHHMFSGVIAWFYKALLGISPMEDHPAFEQLELTPCFIEEPGFVRGKMETVRGVIEAEWRLEGENFRYTVTIPDGIRATFRGQILTTGKNEFIIRKEKRSK